MEGDAMEITLKFDNVCAAYHNIQDLKCAAKNKIEAHKGSLSFPSFCKHPCKMYSDQRKFISTL